MNSKELVAQATAKIEKMCNLTDKIEAIENILKASGEKTEIALYETGVGTTRLSLVLSEAVVKSLKESAVAEIKSALHNNTTELHQLVGAKPEKRKPATINPEFEKAVQEMVKPPFKADHIVKIDGIPKYIDKEPEKEEPPKCEPRSPLNELEVDNVRRMYHDEAKTMKEVAEYYGVTKTRMNSYISKYNLRRTSYNKGSYSDPVDNKKPKPEPLRAQSNVKKCRVCGKNIIINPKMAWGHKYERKQNGKVETAYCCSRECLGIGKMKDV